MAVSTKAVMNNLAAMSNVKLFNALRDKNPSFASITSKATSELFTERGFEMLKTTNLDVINKFTELSLRVAFQLMSVSHAKNPLEESGLVQVYSTPNGGYIQRMAVNTIKPVSPAYKDLKNGDDISPFIVRKPTASERFAMKNFDYQSFITIQDYQLKEAWINTNGMGQYLAGVMEGLQNGYVIQEYANTMEAINAAINSTNFPLQDTQKIVCTFADKDNPTNDELTTFILAMKDLASAMKLSAQTGAYNAGKFKSTIDPSDMVVFIRPGIKNKISVNLMTGAFNPENLSIPFEVREIPNFGGLIPYKDAEFTTRLYPAYDAKTGEQIGFAESEGQTVASVSEDEVFYKDPNEDVIAMVAQKGLIFKTVQNPYSVAPIYNPRGLYTNYWANCPNNGINFDHFYNMVIIKSKE